MKRKQPDTKTPGNERPEKKEKPWGEGSQKGALLPPRLAPPWIPQRIVRLLDFFDSYRKINASIVRIIAQYATEPVQRLSSSEVVLLANDRTGIWMVDAIACQTGPKTTFDVLWCSDKGTLSTATVDCAERCLLSRRVARQDHWELVQRCLFLCPGTLLSSTENGFAVALTAKLNSMIWQNSGSATCLYAMACRKSCMQLYVLNTGSSPILHVYSLQQDGSVEERAVSVPLLAQIGERGEGCVANVHEISGMFCVLQETTGWYGTRRTRLLFHRSTDDTFEAQVPAPTIITSHGCGSSITSTTYFVYVCIDGTHVHSYSLDGQRMQTTTLPQGMHAKITAHPADDRLLLFFRHTAWAEPNHLFLDELS